MIEALVELATEEEWLVCTRHAAVRLELWGYSFQLIVDTRERSEEYASQQWTVRLASPAALLDFPWALSVEGQLAGQASGIARRLAGSIQVDWRCVDWLITPGVWTATGESPLALLQTLATSVGGVLLSQPDGSLLVQPQYAVSPPDWATAGPAATLSTVHDVVTFNLSDETTDGIDTVTVGDSAASDDELRLEEDGDKRRGGVTEVLVYQVPWRDNVTLTHRGDPATAAIYPLGLEERTITDEEIIIQAGEGRAAYPIYALMSARYNARNLGTCEFGEDGAIKTAVIDESILLLSYRTRARRYRVDERLLNDLLLVAADE